MKSRWTGIKCVNCKTIVSNAQLACFSCFSSPEAFRKGKRKALVMNFFLISLFIPSFIITLCSAELQHLPNSQPTSFHASDFDIFYPDANDLTKVRLKRSAGKEQFIAVDQTDEDLANIMIKTWNTNESFDVMSLRWGGNDSNTIFVIMGWRQLSYLPIRKNGSKFFISTDNGITWQEKTDQLRCKDQKGATTLSVSYWTEANPNMFVITDIMNTCIHVTTNLGKNFTSTETSFHPTKL